MIFPTMCITLVYTCIYIAYMLINLISSHGIHINWFSDLHENFVKEIALVQFYLVQMTKRKYK